MPYKPICGIYKITNIVNKKYYIGSAINVKKRINEHKSSLMKNKHYNSHLQSSYNKYGASNFIYEIIETAKNENIIECEQYWIDTLDANNNIKGYNKRKIASSNLGINFSEEAKKNLRLSHLGQKRSKRAQEKISASQYKKVCQFNLDGTYIKTFNSFQEAAKLINIPYTAGISGCVRGVTQSAHGYRWCYEKDFKNFKLKIFKKQGWYKSIKLEITCLTSGITYNFNSITEASKNLPISKQTLSRKNKNKKYRWKRIPNIACF
jgi:group I intron endonuclease